MIKPLYKNISIEMFEQIQTFIDQKTEWFNWQMPFQRHYFDNNTDNFNSSWQDAAYWHKPAAFLDNVDIEIEELQEYDENERLFRLPLEVYLNENIKKFIQKGDLLEAVNSDKWKQIKESPKAQREQRIEAEAKISQLQHEFSQSLNSLIVHIKHYIKDHSADVDQYEKFYFENESGRNTFKRTELIGEITTAFRGVMCGNLFAYECLIDQYVSAGAGLIEEMKNITEQLVSLSREYLIIQYLQKIYTHKRGDKRVTDQQFITAIEKCVDKESGFIQADNKHKTFLTKSGKIKPTPIAEYLHYEMFPGKYSQYRGLVDKVKEVLSQVSNVVERRGSYFKK